MAESLLNQRRMLTRSLRDKEGNRIRGMGIRSAENARVEQDYMERAQRGVANMQMQQLRSQARDAAPDTGATDAAAPTMSASEQLAADRKSRMDYYARINGRPAAPAAGAPATGGAPATTPAAGAPATTPTPATGTPNLVSANTDLYRRSLLRQKQDELDTANAAKSREQGLAATQNRILAGGPSALQAERQRMDEERTQRQAGIDENKRRQMELEQSRLPTGSATVGSPKPTEPFAADRAAIAEARSSTQSLLRMPRPKEPIDSTNTGYPSLPPPVKDSSRNVAGAKQELSNWMNKTYASRRPSLLQRPTL
jgi:hypothetical protein